MNINAAGYRVLASRELFTHPRVSVILDTLEHEGVQRPYVYLASPVEAVATLGVNRDGLVALTRQYRHPIRQVIYDLPAGRMMPGETPLDGARREFEEETGYYPDRMEPLGFFNQFPGSLRAGTHLFFASGLRPTRQNLDEGEELEVHFLPVNAVMEMIEASQVIDGSLQLAVLLALHKGLIAR